MKRILLSYFEPFAGQSENVSQQVVESYLSEERQALESEGIEVQGLCLPVVFKKAASLLNEKIIDTEVDEVWALGQAEKREMLGLEQVALNWQSASITDNEGQQPIDQKIIPGAPPAYFALMPLRKNLEKLQAAGIPSEISYQAGVFVCNEVYFRMLHEIHQQRLWRRVRAAFLHLPLLDRVSMEQQKLALGLLLRGAP